MHLYGALFVVVSGQSLGNIGLVVNLLNGIIVAVRLLNLGGGPFLCGPLN
jgi:hypothetical protein